MPKIYPGSGNIGALLRLIEQERKTAPHARIPAAAPSAPLRKSVAAPLETPIAPESPGTARVVSVKPGVTPPTAPAAPAVPGAVPRALMGQIGGVPKVVAPATYTPPPPEPSTPSPSQPSTPSPRSVKGATASPPTIATKLAPRPSPYEKQFGKAGPAVQEFIEGSWKPAPKYKPAPSKVKQPSYTEVLRSIQQRLWGTSPWYAPRGIFS